MIGIQHIAALRLRNGFDKLFPVIRKDLIRPEVVQPVKIHLPAQEDAAQNQSRDMIRVGLGIQQGQRRPPGPPEQHKLLDLKGRPDGFNVLNKVLRPVLCQRAVRRRATAASLIESDDPVNRRIIKPSRAGVAARPRATVYKQDWHAVRIAGLIHIQLMLIGHFQLMTFVGLNFRIQNMHGRPDRLK